MKKSVICLGLLASLSLMAPTAFGQYYSDDPSCNSGYNSGYNQGKRDTMNYNNQYSPPKSLLSDRQTYTPGIDDNNRLSPLGKENRRKSNGSGSLLN